MPKNFSPFPVLKTGRLTLRQLKNSDDVKIFALRTNADVNKYLDRRPCESMADAAKFIHSINEAIQKNASIYWAITLNATDKLIGTICLFNFSDDLSKVEIGYELFPEFQRKGIMQEASSKVIQFGFEKIGVDSIEAYTHADNQGSKKMLDRLNFKRDSAFDEHLTLFKLTFHNYNKI